MKKHLFLLSILLIQLAAVSVFAQDRLQSGDTITGVVRDFNDGSSLFAVYVTEIDSSSAVKSWASTDVDGRFSFVLVNPGDSIKFSFYRKEKLVLPIDRKNFEIRLEDDKDLPPTSWEDYETLDSREFRDIAERSKNKGLLDISVNTTDPGFYKNIRISDNTIDTTFLNIRMEDAGDLPPVEIISDRVQETGPMPLPIPLRK